MSYQCTDPKRLYSLNTNYSLDTFFFLWEKNVLTNKKEVKSAVLFYRKRIFPLCFAVLKIFAVFEPVLWNECSKEPIRCTDSNCPSLFPFTPPAQFRRPPSLELHSDNTNRPRGSEGNKPSPSCASYRLDSHFSPYSLVVRRRTLRSKNVDSIFADGQMYNNWPVKMENRLWIETCLEMQLQFGNTRVFRSLDCQTWSPGVTVMISFRLTFTERICLCALPPAGQNLNHGTEFGLVTQFQGY